MKNICIPIITCNYCKWYVNIFFLNKAFLQALWFRGRVFCHTVVSLGGVVVINSCIQIGGLALFKKNYCE